ncbi:hypothetical protein [Streptomyces mutabilis]|uniref:hypothetical protein n=1 Tax=Streptomyces mutabilis TaxID=67332 RepID=UPI00343AB76A
MEEDLGDFDCSGEDIERDWVARTGCWSHTERVLLTYEHDVPVDGAVWRDHFVAVGEISP